VKLRHLDGWNDRRRQLAALYEKSLQGLPLQLPREVAGRKHIYHLYSVQTKNRDTLQKHLQSSGVASGLHYPAPLHLQQAFASLGGKKGDYPESEALARTTLSIPLYPHMSDDDVAYVSRSVREFFIAPPTAA
jgi:dTDP-4-amino-4,6-dideoxygalactose transaminase